MTKRKAKPAPTDPVQDQGADLIPFSFEDYPVRTMTRDGVPWFVLADVCKVLEIGTPHKAAERLDDDEKTTLDTRNSIHCLDIAPQAQSVTIINESGLYALIMTSRKEGAKRFRKWVTWEVLPTIRRTGTYGLDQDQMLIQYKEAMEQVKELRKQLNAVRQDYVALEERNADLDASRAQLQTILVEKESYSSKSYEAKLLAETLIKASKLTDHEIAERIEPYIGEHMPEWVAWHRRLIQQEQKALPADTFR